MSYPIYNLNILPAITLPYKDKREVSKKYLGGRALTGEVYLDFDVFMESNTERKALYDFWKNDCNYGTQPFLIPLPLFGETYDKDRPNVLALFTKEIEANKQDIHWTATTSVKAVGTIEYIQDDSSAYITDDSGAFIYNDYTTNSNMEITYA